MTAFSFGNNLSHRMHAFSLGNNLSHRMHDKTNKMTCAPSEDSDQPGHSPSLYAHWVAKDPRFLHADSEG